MSRARTPRLAPQERTADAIDHATETSQQLLEKDIANARAGAAPESDPRFDGKSCVEEDCGVAIPAGRLALGRIRCVECQELIERRGRR